MTLTGKLDGLGVYRLAQLRGHAERHFSGLPQSLWVTALSLFVEPRPDAPMCRVASFPLAS
jgi:hypothetical protein